MSEMRFMVKEPDYGETPYDLVNLVGVKLIRESVRSKSRLITEAGNAALDNESWTPCALKGRMNRYIMPNGDEQVFLDDKLMLTFKPPSFDMVPSEDGLNYNCVCNQPYIEHWKGASRE